MAGVLDGFPVDTGGVVAGLPVLTEGVVAGLPVSVEESSAAPVLVLWALTTPWQ